MPARHGLRILPILLFVGGLTGGILLMVWMQKDAPLAGGASSTTPGGAASDEPALTQQANPLPSGAPGQRDPATELGEALGHADRDARSEGLRKLGRRMAADDLPGGLAMLARIPGIEDRFEFTRALFGAWAERDPRAAMDYAKSKFTPGLQQAEALGAAVEKWGTSNPRQAAAWISEQLNGPLKEQTLTFMMQGWARQDPQDAAAWFIASGSTSQSLLTALVANWADASPQLAAAWVESLKHAENKSTARVSLANQWAMQKPAEAAEYFKPMMTSSGEGLNIGSSLMNAWGSTDPSAAANWVTALPPSAARNEAAGTLATIWASTDIEAAVKWSEGLQDPEIKAGVIDHLGEAWGATDPGKALAWLDTLPADDSRREATAGALNSWAGTDAPGLAEWLKGQPAGERADLARESLGAVQIDSDPRAAMQTALAIAEPQRQQDTAVKLYRQWSRNDPAAAQAWLGQATLPEGVRAKLTPKSARTNP